MSRNLSSKMYEWLIKGTEFAHINNQCVSLFQTFNPINKLSYKTETVIATTLLKGQLAFMLGCKLFQDAVK